MKVLKLGLTLAGGDRGGFGGGGDRDRSGRGLQDRYFDLVGLCFRHLLLKHCSQYFFSLLGLVGGILLRMRLAELEGGLSSQGDHEDICHHGRFGGQPVFAMYDDV